MTPPPLNNGTDNTGMIGGMIPMIKNKATHGKFALSKRTKTIPKIMKIILVQTLLPAYFDWTRRKILLTTDFFFELLLAHLATATSIHLFLLLFFFWIVQFIRISAPRCQLGKMQDTLQGVIFSDRFLLSTFDSEQWNKYITPL